MKFEYESIPVGYYDEVYRKNRGIQSKWHRIKFQALYDLFGANEKHLDIGCGAGTLIGSLPGHIHSTGLDIAQSQIDYARRHYGSSTKIFLTAPGGWHVIAPESFDIVTLIELIEHLEDDKVVDLLRRSHKALKLGGRIVVSTPDYGGPWLALEFLLNRVGNVTYEQQHINHFTKRRLALTLENAGFRIDMIQRYMFAAPFLAAVSNSVADWLNAIEPPFLINRLGFLLLAVGHKR